MNAHRVINIKVGWRFAAALVLVICVGGLIAAFHASASNDLPGDHKSNPIGSNPVGFWNDLGLYPSPIRSLSNNGRPTDLPSVLVADDLPSPALLAYHGPTNELLTYSRDAASLELYSRAARRDLISSDIDASGVLSETQSLASVSEDHGRFRPGEVFLGLSRGRILRVSPDGTAITSTRLNGELSTIDGGLAVDHTEAFGGDLVAVAGKGRIWRMNATGESSLIVDLDTRLKGVTAVPEDHSLYGDLAGTVVVGAPEKGGIFAVRANGSATFFPLGITPVDIDLVRRDQNLFAVSTNENKLWAIAASSLASRANQLVIAPANSNLLYFVQPTGAAVNIDSVVVGNKPDQVTFGLTSLVPNGTECVVSVSPVEVQFPALGGQGSFAISAPADCHWSVFPSARWVQITSPREGQGDATISYTVGGNSTSQERLARLNVNSLAHTVTQLSISRAKCSLFLSPSTQSIGAGGGSGVITVTTRPQCSWNAQSNSPWLTITGSPTGTGSGSVSYSAATNFAGQTRQGQITFSNLIGSATDFSASVTQSPNQPPQVNAGSDQAINLPDLASLGGTATDDGIGNAVAVSWSKLSGPESVVFGSANQLASSALFNKEGTYTLRLTASDGYLSSTDDVQVTVNPDPIPPPPDPITIAPPIESTVATNPFDSTRFIYSGPNAIQTGVAPGTIEETRVAPLRGRVVSKSGQPIPNVSISVLDHPELGQTRTRADGKFDLVVNGGGILNIRYERPGFVPVQREEKPQWQEYDEIDDVVMIPLDGLVTAIDLASATPIQVAEGGVITDASGTRQSRLMFKQGTTATMRLPNGTLQSLVTMGVRITEFTVGNNGPETMPGDLPALSAYTYASEYSVDEAVAIGATNVTFSQPVIQYNENFLGFPVGVNVPSGSFDKLTGIWLPDANGRVVKILSITSGMADLDLTGGGTPATDPEYTALGIDAAERQQLATLYSVDQTLWRVPVTHFSSWDSNWSFGPPAGSGPPNGGPIGGGGPGGSGGPSGGGGPPGPCEKAGCIVGIEDQRLSENISLVGTPYFLRYDSSRPRGTVANYSVRIPLSGATLPGPVKRVEMKVSIAGQVHEFTFPNAPDQSTTFTWDGKDAYGRPLAGQQEATIDIGNVYDGVYQDTANFGYNGNGVPISANTRQEITIHRVQHILLGSYSAPTESLGGWSLSVNHAYDPVGHTLYQGDGRQRRVETVSSAIETFAGGLSGFAGDGGSVSQARFLRPYGLGFAPDGTMYVADTENARIRKVTPDGIVSTFAGNGGGCNPSNFPCGDGGPAVNASFGGVIRVGVARDGSVYIGGGRNLWRVTTDGIFHRVAGLAFDGFSGDGGQARDAAISNATRFALAADGSVYLSDMLNQRIRRIDPNGIITTIAGNGTIGFSGDGGPATQAQLNHPGDIVAAPDGNVYFADQDNNRIRRIATDGVISTFAGTGTFGSSPDGLPALQTNLILRAANPIEGSSMALGPDGSVYVASYTFPSGGRIRRIAPDGIVHGVSGNNSTTAGRPAEGSPALGQPMRLASFALAPDGSIYTVGGFTFDFYESRIWRISAPLPNFDGANIAIPSEDGAQLFQFNAQGRHLATMNTYTGATLLTFNYDPAGRLVSIVDGDNNTTTIERDGAGNPTGIRSPYNQLTAFTRDSNGYLASITNPNNEVTQFTYSAAGLMGTKRDPRNGLSTYTYDALGRLVRDDDAFGGSQTLARVDSGVNFTVTHDTGLGLQSSYQVNFPSNGDRQRVNTGPDGLPIQLTEGADGKNTQTDPDGTITSDTSGGHPRWKLQAPITTSHTATTPANLTLNRTFARSSILADPADQLSLTSQSDTLSINGRTYTNVFTAATRTFAMTTPENRHLSAVIDQQGRLTGLTHANLEPFAYSYDTRGRLDTSTRGTGAAARTYARTYNANGFLASLTDPMNQTSSFSRDASGRLTALTLADNRLIGFAYDANGNLTSLTPSGRPAHVFTYNAVDLTASYTAPDVGGNSTTTYDHDLDRRLTRVTRPDALQINYGYDAAGRLQSIGVPNGSYAYAYSASTGTLSTITAPGGGVLAYQYDGSLPTGTTWTGAVAGSVSQTFDANFRVASQSVNGGSTVNFGYDDDALLTSAGSITLARDAQNGLVNGSTIGSVSDTYTYNGFAETTNYDAEFNSTSIYDCDYTYDKLGRITQKIETIGGGTTTYAYGYDQTGRLATVTVNGAPQPLVTYGYDANNNRTSVNVGGNTTNATFDAQDRMTSYGSATYAYTANGELLSKSVLSATTTYGYDVLGNLRSVVLPDSTQIEYLIDGQNRRIGKRVNGVLIQGLLYHDAFEPVAELDGNNNIVSRFVYGSRSNTPDYMVKGGSTYRIITDQIGSVRLVVDVSTGAIAQRIDYDEYGVVLNDTNPGFQPFGFAGGIYDTQTKLTRFGARDYDAETGRWTAKDPILFLGRSANLYSYAHLDPVNRTDLNGLGGKNLCPPTGRCGSGGAGGGSSGGSGGSGPGSSGPGGPGGHGPFGMLPGPPAPMDSRIISETIQGTLGLILSGLTNGGNARYSQPSTIPDAPGTTRRCSIYEGSGDPGGLGTLPAGSGAA